MSAEKISDLLQAAQWFKQQGQVQSAIESLQEAAALDASSVPILYNLANAQKQAGQLVAALANYHAALALNADSPEVNFNLGNTLLELEDYSHAQPFFIKVIALWPHFAPAHSNLGRVFEAQGQFEAALASHQQASSLAPHQALPYINLGNCLVTLGRYGQAEQCFRHALTLQADSVEALCNLGHALQGQERWAEALPYRERALQLAPDSAIILSAVANTLWALGDVAQSIALNRRAVAVQPDLQVANSNLLFVYAYATDMSPQKYRDEACALMSRMVCAVTQQRATQQVWRHAPRQGRRLRVGYLSGDFRTHAVSCFIEEIFAAHDPERVELYAYSNNPTNDDTTQRLRRHTAVWRDVRAMSDESLAGQIRADQVDILIDLSGHNANHRLMAIALRAAPVQAHYLGYVATTGLAEMDYWIADAVLVPEWASAHFCETVWRLPRTWVSYAGRPEAPEVASRAHGQQAVCLGSFNNLAKITPATLALWARVLNAVPNSKLLLKTKAFHEPGNVLRTTAELALYGVSTDRIALRSSVGNWAEHMGMYAEMDIALDPIGSVGGGTTTCDALWMGVPVISLKGEKLAQRMTASMVDALGHPEWAVATEADYIAAVQALANDPVRRQDLRAKQREKMRYSPLCDAVGLSRALEDAYEAMFDHWWDRHLFTTPALTVT
jgi:protein O-GlcNAc transferase